MYLSLKISASLEDILHHREKTQAIAEIKPSKNLHDLQCFLGLVNYLYRFCPTLAELAAPLRGLCKKDTFFVWDRKQHAAFEDVKEEITRVPALNYFVRSVQG